MEHSRRQTKTKSEPPDPSLRERLVAGKVWARGKDGAAYLIRPIRPDDAAAVTRSYDSLPDRSKWFRLLYSVPRLSEEMAARFCTPDPKTEFAVVIEGNGRLAGELIGGARIADMGPGKAAEFAVTLREEAQGLGLARQALETVIEVARDAGCGSVWGTISAENRAMLGLARRLEFIIRRDPEDLSLMLAEKPFEAD